MRLPRFIDLWRRRPDAAKPRDEVTAPDVPGPDDDGEAESFRRALLRILNSRPETAAGKINFVNLEPLQARLGERWERARSRVDQLACKIIEEHLSPEDLFSRYDELNYLVVFASVDEDVAAFKCAKIAEKIFGALFGVEGMAMAGVRCLSAGVDGRIVVAEKSLNDCVAALAEKAEERAVAANRVTTFQGGNAAGTPAARTRDGDRVGADSDGRRVPAAAGGGPAPEPLRFRYSPFWNVGKQAVTVFRCAADPSGSDADAWMRGFPGTFSLFSAMDVQTLHHSAQALQAAFRASTKYLCVVPVHVGTLVQPKSRDLYVKFLKGVPEATRKCIALELTDIPADMPTSRLEGAAAVVKPLIREILWLLELRSTHLAKRTPPGVTGVGIDISACSVGEAELITVLNNFAIAAERRQLASYLSGTASRSLILAAAAAGLTFVDGSGTLGTSASPQTMFSFKWEQLYGDLSPQADG